MQRTYQGNQSKTPAPAKAGAAKMTPTKDFVPSEKGTQPTFLLKVKGEDGNFVTLTGLFANEGKNGIYYKGKARDGEYAGVDFFVMSKLPDSEAQ